jgi:hypothetical protein
MNDLELWSTRAERATKVPLEDKQRFLDLLWEGKTIGEVRAVLGWDLALACGVLDEQVLTTSTLRRTATGQPPTNYKNG